VVVQACERRVDEASVPVSYGVSKVEESAPLALWRRSAMDHWHSHAVQMKCTTPPVGGEAIRTFGAPHASQRVTLRRVCSGPAAPSGGVGLATKGRTRTMTEL